MPNKNNVLNYADIVLEFSQRRAMKDLAYKITKGSESEDISKVITSASIKLSEIAPTDRYDLAEIEADAWTAMPQRVLILGTVTLLLRE